MAKISKRISESLDEYLILTGWIESKPEEVSLETNLGNIELQYPYMTSRMQCVVGKEMAVAAGRNGILTMVPRSLRDEDKEEIIEANNKARLKKGDIEFQENPEAASVDSTLEDVVKIIKRSGHSVIPITDRFSKLHGVYVHDANNPPDASTYIPITEIMIPLQNGNAETIPYLVDDDDKEKIKDILRREKRKFLPILDSKGILQKIAFSQKFNTNYIGIAITTRKGWEEELERYGNRVDALCIDSSNACFDDAIKILRNAKARFPDKPFGIGNLIKGEDFKIFAEAGADFIIGGMGVGSICKTGATRGNGRGQFTVAVELGEARDEFSNKRGKYVPIVIDGGIANLKAMLVALAFGDFLMMGNYFNKFYESAADKFEADKKTITRVEQLIRYVESWGEGHPRARMVGKYGMDFRRILAEKTHKPEQAAERYGHATLAGATIEGVVGLVEYRGRLKPSVEDDARYLRTTMYNSGASNLKEFREKAFVEKASEKTMKDMLPHDLLITEQ